MFKELYEIDCNKFCESKKNLKYLSWAHAWKAIKEKHPKITYSIKMFDNNMPYVYDESTGYMVFTEVTIDGLTHVMWLPVMDGANKAMKNKEYKYWGNKWENGKKVRIEKTVDPATMFDINKTIMRCLTKNLAMFGLGLYIYAGEDLPESTPDTISSSQVAELEANNHNGLLEPELLRRNITINEVTVDLYSGLLNYIKGE